MLFIKLAMIEPFVVLSRYTAEPEYLEVLFLKSPLSKSIPTLDQIAPPLSPEVLPIKSPSIFSILAAA